MIFLCTPVPLTPGWMISIATSCLGPDNEHGRTARGARSKIEIL
jgi:hypothetical protein